MRAMKGAAWALMALVSIALALLSYRYLPRVGPLVPDILVNLYATPWLAVHVAAAATALLVGAFQFLGPVRRLRPSVHRWTGRLYVAGAVVGGIAGLLLALGSTAGPVATAGFGLLALGWMAATAQGWRSARSWRFESHRRWMIRSWALTLAAVTLRLYLPMIEPLGFAFAEGYRAISFLCWVPNLVIAEIWIVATRRRARALGGPLLQPG